MSIICAIRINCYIDVIRYLSKCASSNSKSANALRPQTLQQQKNSGLLTFHIFLSINLNWSKLQGSLRYLVHSKDMYLEALFRDQQVAYNVTLYINLLSQNVIFSSMYMFLIASVTTYPCRLSLCLPALWIFSTSTVSSHISQMQSRCLLIVTKLNMLDKITGLNNSIYWCTIDRNVIWCWRFNSQAPVISNVPADVYDSGYQYIGIVSTAPVILDVRGKCPGTVRDICRWQSNITLLWLCKTQLTWLRNTAWHAKNIYWDYNIGNLPFASGRVTYGCHQIKRP